MKTARFIALFLTLLLPTYAMASTPQEAIAQLTDQELIKLWAMATEEAQNRGLTSDELTKGIKLFTAKLYAEEQFEAAQNKQSNVKETPKPTFAPLVQLTDEDTVWISKSGKRYHTTPDCSGMRTAKEVTLSEAIEKGLTPCRDCAYWLEEKQ